MKDSHQRKLRVFHTETAFHMNQKIRTEMVWRLPWASTSQWPQKGSLFSTEKKIVNGDFLFCGGERLPQVD